MSERAKGSQIEVEGKTLPEKLSDLQADINSKANADAVAQALESKADADAVAQALETKADNSAVSLALAGKADKSELNGLATEAFVSQAVSGLATDTAVAGKADKTYVDTELGQKADADAVGLALAQKADATALAAKADASALDQLRSDAVLVEDLASETGNSTTKVMSQKGVTDAIRAAGGDIEEAPIDGKEYARKDGDWVEVVGGGGDVEEAPIDGKQYARKDAGWEEVVAGGDSSVDVYVALQEIDDLVNIEEEPTDYSAIGWMLDLQDGMTNVLIDPEEGEGQSALYAPIIINKSSIEFVEEGDTKQFIAFKVSLLTSLPSGGTWESTYVVVRNITTGVDTWSTEYYRLPLGGGGGVSEAPTDGGLYGRSNEGWQEIDGTSRVEITGGTAEAPLTFEQVGRLIHAWFREQPDIASNVATNFSFTGIIQGDYAVGYPGYPFPLIKHPINYTAYGFQPTNPKIFYKMEKAYLGLGEIGISAMFSVEGLTSANPSKPVDIIQQYADVYQKLPMRFNIGEKSLYLYEMETVNDNYTNPGTGVYGARNTFEVIIDSNGFIKESSPILKLYSNSLESNGDKAFTNETALTKTGVGVYEISGVPLLSRNGWYIETPKDRNNNIYFTIDYEEVPEENKLIIRTYEPDYSSGKAENGNPVDILEGRFVSLRFEEVEEEEVEEEVEEEDVEV